MNMKYYFKPKEYIKELKADILKCERIADNRYAIAMQLYKWEVEVGERPSLFGDVVPRFTIYIKDGLLWLRPSLI